MCFKRYLNDILEKSRYKFEIRFRPYIIDVRWHNDVIKNMFLKV